MRPSDATTSSPDVLIVGAGVAGALAARHLASAGVRTSVVDPDPPFPGTSERRGALYMRPAVNYSPETRFAHQAFLAASDCYTRLQKDHPDIAFWHPTGTLSLAWHEREQQRQHKLLTRNRWSGEFLEPVSARQASSLTGLPVNVPGLWFPTGGHVQVDELRRAALSHELITTHPVAASPDLSQGKPGKWGLSLTNGESLSASTLICAAGAGSEAWAPALPFNRIRGQLTTVPAIDSVPRVAVAGGGYALPPLDGRVCVGATFDRDSPLESADTASDQANIENLAQWFPSLGKQLRTSAPLGHWVGFRSTTPDHMPVAGNHGGRFLLAGMGGKGLVYAPLLAEHIAARILDTPSPLDEDTDSRVSPERFLGC